ncbi:MAG: KH domain-containing protein [Spirochaetaceae bacterium]|nr:KH domain-containing protein [Spirochaetaceae bacterium]
MEQDLIKYIVTHLVDDPEAVRVDLIDGEKTKVLELRVGKGDEGRIIGKGGSMAKAMRTVLQAASSKSGRRFALEIIG